MGFALHSYKIDSDGRIRVRHTFYGDTEDDVRNLQTMHAGGCKAYGPAVKRRETIDVLVEDVDPPTAEDCEDFDGDVPDPEDAPEEDDDDGPDDEGGEEGEEIEAAGGPDDDDDEEDDVSGPGWPY
jgi:hypothetical protein